MTLFTSSIAAEAKPLLGTAPGGRALILDDSEVDRLRLRRIAQDSDLDLDFVEAATIADFASKLDAGPYRIVFLDYRLVQGDGLIALEMLHRHPVQSNVPSVMIAGEGQIQVAIDAMKGGCSDFLIKDKLTPDLLRRAVSHAIEKTELRASLSAEEEMRTAMQNSLGRFAAGCGSEMRSILSGMLRHVRAMRRNPATITADEVGAVERSCERLWGFLEEFQEFVSETSTRERPPVN